MLDLQATDVRLDQLDHQLATLPGLATVEKLNRQIADLDADMVIAATELSDLQAALERAENEVAQVRQRAKRDQDLLDSGSITVSKQLSELQRELATLKRRQDELEDAELEVMESVETAQERVDALATKIAEATEQRTQTQAEVDAAAAEIEDERGQVSLRRDALAVQVPSDLRALYERLRSSLGVAAARLNGNRCEGCHMQLSPTDLQAIASSEADDVVRCEECTRILVRAQQ